MTRAARAAAVTTAGASAVAGGVWLTAGPGPALIVGGALAAAYGLLVADVTEPTDHGGT